MVFALNEQVGFVVVVVSFWFCLFFVAYFVVKAEKSLFMFLIFNWELWGAYCHFCLSLFSNELYVYIPYSSSYLTVTTCPMATHPCFHIPNQQSKQSTFPSNIFNPKPLIS